MESSRLKKIPVGASSESAQIRPRKRYRVRIEGKWYEGMFSKQWFGWRFEGYGASGMQLNLIEEVYEVLAPESGRKPGRGSR